VKIGVHTFRQWNILKGTKAASGGVRANEHPGTELTIIRKRMDEVRKRRSPTLKIPMYLRLRFF
jgi:hypothetical protein